METLKQVKTHPIYSRSAFSHSHDVITLAEKCLHKQTSEDFVKFQEELIISVWKILSSTGNKIGGSAEDALCTGLRKLRENEHLKTLWFVVTESDAQPSLYIFLHILRQMFAGLVKARNEMDAPPREVHHEVELSDHDEQVLRYASGYIPFALITFLKHQQTDRTKALTAFLQTWKVLEDNDSEEMGTFLLYTR